MIENITDRNELIRIIDRAIGESDFKKIDSILIYLRTGEHSFDEKVCKFVLGYTKIVDRDLKEWEPLFYSINL